MVKVQTLHGEICAAGSTLHQPTLASRSLVSFYRVDVPALLFAGCAVPGCKVHPLWPHVCCDCHRGLKQIWWFWCGPMLSNLVTELCTIPSLSFVLHILLAKFIPCRRSHHFCHFLAMLRVSWMKSGGCKSLFKLAHTHRLPSWLLRASLWALTRLAHTTD